MRPHKLSGLINFTGQPWGGEVILGSHSGGNLKQLVLAAAFLACGAELYAARISYTLASTTQGIFDLRFSDHVVEIDVSCNTSTSGSTFGHAQARCEPLGEESDIVRSSIVANLMPTTGNILIRNQENHRRYQDEELGAEVVIDTYVLATTSLNIKGKYAYRGVVPYTHAEWLDWRYDGTNYSGRITVNGITVFDGSPPGGEIINPFTFMPGETYEVDLDISGEVKYAESFYIDYKIGPLSSIPEPSTYAMLGAGLAGLLMLRRIRR